MRGMHRGGGVASFASPERRRRRRTAADDGSLNRDAIDENRKGKLKRSSHRCYLTRSERRRMLDGDGDELDDVGRYTERRRSSPASGCPSMHAPHRDEEDGETKLLDNSDDLEEAQVAGDLRATAAAV